jgi:hypothetical protein
MGWVEKAPLPRGAMGIAVAVSGGYLYAFGGRDYTYNNLATTSRYDPVSDTWAPMAEMPAPRNWAGAAEAGGYMYVVNGSEGGGPLNTVFRYDVAGNSWTVMTPTVGSTYGPAVVSLNGEVYRIGGLDPGGVFTSSVEVLGRGFVAPLPEGRSWASAVAMGGYIYVAGGNGKMGFSTKTYRYDPATDSWSDGAIADLPEPKGFSAAGALDGRFVVAGGGTKGSYGTVWAWDAQTDTWESMPSLLYPRFNMPGGVVGGVMHVVGGINDQLPTDTHQAYDPAGCATATSTITATPTGTATSTATSTATPTACTLRHFEDVPDNSTFFAYAQCLACRGIMSGYPCGGPGEPCSPPYNWPWFRPNNPSTRAQLSKVVTLAAGFGDPVGEQTFEDVPASTWHFTFTGQLAMRGIVQGYVCGSEGEPCVPPGNRPYFRPNNTTSRGQLAKMVCRAYGCMGTVSNQSFEDVPPGSTFYEDVEHLHGLGVIGGYPCGGVGEPCVPPENRPYFRPGSNVTRGQTSKIVANTFYPECQVEVADR